MEKTDLKNKALNLCYAIEELPASEQQTKISIMADELFWKIDSRTLEPIDDGELTIFLEIIRTWPGEPSYEESRRFIYYDRASSLAKAISKRFGAPRVGRERLAKIIYEYHGKEITNRPKWETLKDKELLKVDYLNLADAIIQELEGK